MGCGGRWPEIGRGGRNVGEKFQKQEKDAQIGRTGGGGVPRRNEGGGFWLRRGPL